MIVKIGIIALLCLIIYFLASAAALLVKGDTRFPEKLAKALRWRISLSIVVFLLIMFAFMMGWITPQLPVFAINQSQTLS